jgi:hypothetical protein
MEEAKVIQYRFSCDYIKKKHVTWMLNTYIIEGISMMKCNLPYITALHGAYLNVVELTPDQ